MLQHGLFKAIACLAAGVLLVACGGGGGGSGGPDIRPGAPSVVAATDGPDSFLLFPNAQRQADGSLQVDSIAYATAYYEAIDPSNRRATLADFKALNGIGASLGAGEIEKNVIFGDIRDLGYGRKMTARKRADGTLAFVVENYLVGGYGGYSPLNFEAATVGASQWHIGTNAIEFSPGPNGGVPFVKFYTYDPVTGARLMAGNLDGRGYKAMPTVCISCHGGRGDPLTPAVGGRPLFPLVMNSVSQHRGDVQARLHPFEPAALDFAASGVFSRASQEADIKVINKMILCSYPIPASATPDADDGCRRTATQNEYQGTVVTHLKDMYGGSSMPLAAANATDTYKEASWVTAGQTDLYLKVQAQACRVCHLLRGTGNQSDIAFETFPHFDGYKDRIKAHIVDRGNMPLAKLIYDKFWSTPDMYGTMATYLTADLTGFGYAAGYADGALKPGRPVADPGPGRVVKPGATTLSGLGSLYSTGYQWSVVSGPAGATLTNPTSAQPVFTAATDGTYTLQLVTSKGATLSTPTTLKLVVDSTLPYTPTALRFNDIRAVLQVGAGACTTCHQVTGESGGGIVIPPIWYTSYDRVNADGNTVANDATNDHWFYTELRGRINFADIVASPLLRKPSGHHHYGAQRTGFNDSLAPGQTGRADYDKVLNWILNGAPE